MQRRNAVRPGDVFGSSCDPPQATHATRLGGGTVGAPRGNVQKHLRERNSKPLLRGVGVRCINTLTGDAVRASQFGRKRDGKMRWVTENVHMM